MPYEVEAEAHGFAVQMTGHVTFDEIVEANDLLLNHALWVNHRYQIWIIESKTAIEEDNRSGRVISKVDGMSLERSHKHRVKIAFVSTNAKTNEFITSYIDSVDKALIAAQIFPTEAAARSWIGAS